MGFFCLPFWFCLEQIQMDFSNGGDWVEFRVFFFFLPATLSPLSPDCMRDTCLPPVPSAPLSAIPPPPRVPAPLLFPTHKDLHRMELRSHSYNYSNNNNKTRTKDLKEEILCISSSYFLPRL